MDKLPALHSNVRILCSRDFGLVSDPPCCSSAKIAAATIGNANILLQIDNSKLAADDFKNK